jgi:hypothetical protein
MNDLEILIDATPGAATALPRASEPTTELSMGDFLELDGRRVPQLPPAPKKSVIPPPAPSTRPPAGTAPARETEETGEYSLSDLLSANIGRTDGAKGKEPARSIESSVISSMEDIQRLEAERVAQEKAKQAEAAAKPKPPEEPKRAEETSVMRSMKELQGIEEQRVVEEADARADAEANARSLEANLRKLHDEHKASLNPGNDLSALLEGEPGAGAEPGKRVAKDAKQEPFIFLEPEIQISGETSISISIELLLGLPWEDQHSVYRLTGREQEDCEKVLPERETRWVLPVPPKDSKDKGDVATLKQFANETAREFNGREYYIVKAAFGGAKRAARTGCLLHIWPESSTDYEYLGEVSGETGLSQPMTGEWSINMKCHIMSGEEIARCSSILPDNRPVFLHPVPPSEEQVALERSLMESFHEGRIPRIALGGKEYFVMEIGTVAEWQELAFMFPNLRIASRKGEWLGIWPESETGKAMMSFEYGFERAHHGPQGPPLLESGGLIEPYESELAAIRRLHPKSEKRWLYALPEKIRDMDSDTLNFLTVISSREIEMTGVSPLISLSGRWYISMKYPHPDAREASLEGAKVRVAPKVAKIKDVLADVRAKSAEHSAKGQTPMIVLPPDPEQRKPLLGMFPEGETRYLYYVDPKNNGYVALKPHVALMRGKEKEVYLVLKEPYEGAIPVRREGISIYPLE